jgi:hypothetical protein
MRRYRSNMHIPHPHTHHTLLILVASLLAILGTNWFPKGDNAARHSVAIHRRGCAFLLWRVEVPPGGVMNRFKKGIAWWCLE